MKNIDLFKEAIEHAKLVRDAAIKHAELNLEAQMATYRKKAPSFTKHRLNTAKKEFIKDILSYVAKHKFYSAISSNMGPVQVGTYTIDIGMLQRILELNYYTDSQVEKLNGLRTFYRHNILKYKK